MTTFMGLILAFTVTAGLLPYPFKPVSPILYRGDTHMAATPVLFYPYHPKPDSSSAMPDSLSPTRCSGTPSSKQPSTCDSTVAPGTPSEDN